MKDLFTNAELEQMAQPNNDTYGKYGVFQAQMQLVIKYLTQPSINKKYLKYICYMFYHPSFSRDDFLGQLDPKQKECLLQLSDNEIGQALLPYCTESFAIKLFKM